MGESSKKKGFIIADDGTIIRGDSEDGKKGWIIIAVVLIAIVTIGLTMYMNSSEWGTVSYYEPDEWGDTVPYEYVEETVSEPLVEEVIVEEPVADASYVDLGLPSGTLWKYNNEEGGFYTYDEAVSYFGCKLPTVEQMNELRSECQWEWKGNGYNVKGANGNEIFLPAAGYRYCSGRVSDVGSEGYYWSTTSNGSGNAWGLFIGSEKMYVNDYYQCSGLSVRLVQEN